MANGDDSGVDDEHTIAAFVEHTAITFPVAWDDGSYPELAWPESEIPYPRQALVGRDGRIAYLATEYRSTDLQEAISEAMAE